MTDLISRLRDLHMQCDGLSLYAEAADEIERLRTELANVNNEFGSQTADWPDAWKRVADLKQLSNDRWREAERLRAALRNLLDMDVAYMRGPKVEEAVEAARAALKEPMHCPKDGGECGAGGYCRPEPVQRKPLTDDEALALIRATPQEDVTQEGWIRRQRLSWVRAIERAHGIGETP